MKLGAVTKPDKKNTATSKKVDSDVMLANFDVIIFFDVIIYNTAFILLPWVKILILAKNPDFLQKRGY